MKFTVYYLVKKRITCRWNKVHMVYLFREQFQICSTDSFLRWVCVSHARGLQHFFVIFQKKPTLLPILTSGGRANDNPGVEFKSKEVVPDYLWSSIIIL